MMKNNCILAPSNLNISLKFLNFPDSPAQMPETIERIIRRPDMLVKLIFIPEIPA
jgi:hypothetical protein